MSKPTEASADQSRPKRVYLRPPEDWAHLTQAQKKAWALGFVRRIKGDVLNEGMPEAN